MNDFHSTGPGPLVLNCSHGIHPSQPCAACGRGYPAPVYTGPDYWLHSKLDRIIELLEARPWATPPNDREEAGA